jgi:TIR domain
LSFSVSGGSGSSQQDVDFFISRRGAQAAVAQEVADVLKEAGYGVLVQDFDFKYSDNFVAEMHFALKRARHLIVLLTQDYDRSAFTLTEVSNFLAAAARDGGEHRLIVLRADNCELEGIFAGIVYADLFGVDDPLERKRRILAAAERRSLAESRGVTSSSRELVGRLRNAAAASNFAGKIESFLEEYLISEDLGAVPFAGRNEELDRLDAWLDDPSAAPRLILAATAGRGKSALVIQWMARLETRKRLGNGDGGWSLVFVPISMRFNTNRPEVFYEAIAARLAEAVGETLSPAHLDPAAYYQDHCRRFLNAAIRSQRRTLLIIDGIDEAVGASFDASWFPRASGSHLRLFVTARLQVGDKDSRGWQPASAGRAAPACKLSICHRSTFPA